MADLASGHLDVLLSDSVLHIDRRNAEIGEFVGIEPHAHRVTALAEDLHVNDTLETLERIDYLQVGVVAQGHRVDRFVR